MIGPRPRSRFLFFAALVLAAISLFPGRSAAEVKLQVALDPETVEIGEQAVLSVSVDGAVKLDQAPSVPPVAGLEVRGAGQSTNISIVNGRMSRSATFQFVLYSRQAGIYSIGPVEVRDGGKLYKSDVLTLRVSAAGGGGGGSSSGGSGGGRPAPGATVYPPGATSAPDEPVEESGDIFARASVDRDHVYAGEQITLRFQFYQRLGYPLLDAPQYTPPETEGFWREDIPPQRTSTRTIHNDAYQVTELVYALFPTQSGRLQIGPGSLDCVVRERSRARDPFSFFGGFGGGRQVRIQSKPIAIRVDPLPEPKPVDFTGGVGRYALSASLEPLQAAQNEPVTLTLKVEGDGNVSTVGDPPMPEMVGLRTYPSGSDVRTEKRGDVVSGKKTFNVVLVPESTGRREIPAVHLSIFDPAARRYVRLETEPIALQVSPARDGGGSTDGEVARLGRDLRTIRAATELRSMGPTHLWKHPGFLAWQIAPFALLALGWVWRVRRERREENWGMVLSRGAAGRLRRDLEGLKAKPVLDPGEGFDRLGEALERYFTDRFRMPVRGRTRDELRERLAQEGITPEGWGEVSALLDRCDFARFAAQARTEEDFREALEMAWRLPLVVEVKGPARPRTSGAGRLLVLAFLTGMGFSLCGTAAPAASMTKEEAGKSFQRGNEAYQRGDNLGAIREYGRALAAGYQSPDLFLNLGNASYRAGRLGWAIYYFERGRQLNPSDPDLRANLDLALQETKDRVPEVDSSHFLKGLVWLQDRASLDDALLWTSRFWWLFLVWGALRLALGGGGLPSSRAAAWIRGKGGWVLGMSLGLLLFLSGSWAGVKAVQNASAPDAVVVQDELAARSNPDPESTVEFTLHAGTRVRLGRGRHGFREVVFSPKLRGWADAAGLAALDASGEESIPAEDRAESGEGSGGFTSGRPIPENDAGR